MSEKRKISVRKILQTLLTLVVTVGCIMAMVSAASIAESETVKDVAIHIQNNKKYHFIEETEIRKLAIENKSIDVAHTPMAKLDIHAMEQTIMADPWVAHAQVYIDNERILHMYVTQRVPVARVFQQNNKSYYLDTTKSVMPLSENELYYTTVVTNVPELGTDSASMAMKNDIVKLATTLQSDTFWNAQISHVYVDSDMSYNMIPLLGDQKITLGNTDGLRDKLSNLFAFYKNVSNRIGWDKYERLDLRFKGQIIASPSLPYKGPLDKAVDKMNWIASIVETEARNDMMDSMKTADVAAEPQEGKAKSDNKKQEAKAKEDAKKTGNKEADKKETKKNDKKETDKKETDKKDKKNADAKKEKSRVEAKDKKHASQEKQHKESKAKAAENDKHKAAKHKEEVKKEAARKATTEHNKDKKSAEKHNKEKVGKDKEQPVKEQKDKNAKQPTPKYVYPEKLY